MASTGITVVWVMLFVLLFFCTSSLCMMAVSHCLRAHCRDFPPAAASAASGRAVPTRPRERLQDDRLQDASSPPRKWMGVIVENPGGEKTLGV